jgi:Na+/H+-dicarboxylate symporter
MNILRNSIFQISLAVIFGFFLESFLSLQSLRLFFTISQFLKDFLMVLLPFLIFFSLGSVLFTFKKSAPLLILGLFVFVILSNFLSVSTAYGFAYLFLPTLCEDMCLNINQQASEISTLFIFPLKPFFKSDMALLSGAIVGVACIFFEGNIQKNIVIFLQKGKVITTTLLKKGFIPFLPLYIFGFILKLQHDGFLTELVHSYGKVFILNIILIIGYILFMYLVSAKFSFFKALRYIKTMLPAGLTGLSTMSSMAALPVTIEATKENLKGSDYADFVIPATANNHMVGDGLNIAITAIALLLMTDCGFPSLKIYLVFVIHYCIVKFSGVGVPGGGVLVILPVIQTYLGLSAELTSLLATIYILQDALLTSANVMANGAFAIITHRVFEKLKWIKKNN